MENKNNKVSKIPSYADLQKNPEAAFKSDQLNSLLCLPPPKKWIGKHPFATRKNEQGKTVPYEYLPADKCEYLIRRIFKRYRREIKDVKLVLNSVVVTVRLHYLNPITGEWDYHDGVGAVGIQMDKGSKMSDIGNFKLAGVQMAVPAAATFAFKDAAECLGDLFGANLNRKDTIQFTMEGAERDERKKEKQESERPTSDTNKSQEEFPM